MGSVGGPHPEDRLVGRAKMGQPRSFCASAAICSHLSGYILDSFVWQTTQGGPPCR